MLKKWLDGASHVDGFILANSIVAASLIVMALVWLGMCQQQLKFQRDKMRTNLRVARLAKEATDAVVVTGRQANLSDQQFTAKATSRNVVVLNGGQIVYEVRL